MKTFVTFITEDTQPTVPPTGECFRNVNRWNAQHAQDGDLVVHGKVTNGEGKRFAHAWIESGKTVIDPTTDVTLPKAEYYKLLKAKADAKYSSRDAIRNQIKAMHHGPWTKADLGAKP